jgi:prevent-host-death family protein
MEVGIHEAKTKLSKLIPVVLSGEEVIITKFGYPLVKLVPVQELSGKRQLGLYEGKIKFNDDILKPLPDEIIENFWRKDDDNAISP